MRTREVIGLIPCGGHAHRIAPLPCSKEVLPVGLHANADGSLRPKVVSQYLLEKMQRAGVRKAFFILRKGKWDIPEYYGAGASLGMDLGYLMVRLPYGPPYTLDQAYPFVRGAQVAFGFPDILFEPVAAFGRALERLRTTRSDLVMGLYRANDKQVTDRVLTDRTGRVREMTIRPVETISKFTWIFAVWTAVFTEFMHQYLAAPRTSEQRPGAALPAELTVGHVIQAAIREGLVTQSVTFPRNRYLDIGTSDGLRQAAAVSWNQPV